MENKRFHCAIDLELEQPNTRHDCRDSHISDSPKIIQLGYVIYGLEPEFEIIQMSSYFINIGVPICSFIKKLTGISDEDIASGISINDAYDCLHSDVKKHKCSRILKQWGTGDDVAIRNEITNKPWAFGYGACNIKHIFQIYAESNSMNTSGGLNKSLKKCGLDWEGGKQHNAMYDALNTARMHNFLYNKLKNKR